MASSPRSRSAGLVIVAVLVVAIALAGTCIGAVLLSPAQVLDGIAGGPNAFIVQEYRLPRVAVTLLAGAALAVSGLLLQAAVRNPLASPDVIGVTKGAALGAMTATVLVPAAAQFWAVPLGIATGSALVTAIILLLAGRVGSRGATLALVGIAIAALAGAAMEYLMTVFPQKSDQAMVWLAGSAYGSNATDVGLLSLWLVVCLPAVIACTRLLDLSGFGDDSLSSLGHTPARVRMLFVVTAVALAGGAVATVGGIGFLGLLAPHLARSLFGARPAWVVPASALLGAALLAAADLAGRLIALPNEIPAGIVAAVIGGPYLLFVLIREARARG